MGWPSPHATKSCCITAVQSPELDINQNKSIAEKWYILSWRAQEWQCKEGGMSAIKRLQEAGKVPVGCKGAFTGMAVSVPL